MSAPALHWQTLLGFPTGYATSAGGLLRALDARGVPVTYEYHGDGSADQPFHVRAGGLGDANTRFDDDCGEPPDEIAFATHVAAGDAISGTLCLIVPIEDLTNGTWTLFAESGGPLAYFAVR